jgi:hypothetical protein
VLKSKPFFKKNPNHDWLYTEQPVAVSDALREELLANEIPALTFAAGHKGIQVIRDVDSKKEMDIRQKFAVNKPWPRDSDEYEWRHSDIYNVAYPYLTGLYDEWVKKIQGVEP